MVKTLSVFLYDSSIMVRFPDETSWEIQSLSSLEMILNRYEAKRGRAAIDVYIESGITRFRLIHTKGLSWIDRTRLLIKLYREEPYAEAHDAVTLQKKGRLLVVGSTHLTDFAREALRILSRYSISRLRLWYQSWKTDPADQTKAILLHDEETHSQAITHMVLIDEGAMVLARQTQGFHQREDQQQILERLSATTKKQIAIMPWRPKKGGEGAFSEGFFCASSPFLQKSMSQYRIQRLFRRVCLTGILFMTLLTAVTPWCIGSIREEADGIHAQMVCADPSPEFLRREVPLLLCYEGLLKKQQHPFVLLTPCTAVLSALEGAVVEDLLWEADQKALSFTLKIPSLTEQTHDDTSQELAERFKTVPSSLPLHAKIHPLAQKNMWNIRLSSDHSKK